MPNIEDNKIELKSIFTIPPKPKKKNSGMKRLPSTSHQEQEIVYFTSTNMSFPSWMPIHHTSHQKT